MKRVTFLIAFLCVLAWCVGASDALAQNGIVSIRRIVGHVGGDTVMAGQPLKFFINFNNNSTRKADVSNGYQLTSPDGAVWDSTTIDSIGPINDGGTPEDPSDDFSVWFVNRFNIAASFQEFSADGMGADTVGFIGAGTPTLAARQLPATWNDTVYAITAWFSNKSSAGKHICIDSSFYGTGGTWKWVISPSLGVLLDIFPEWQGVTPSQVHNPPNGSGVGGGYCFYIYDPDAPQVTLQVAPTQLDFTATAGGANPPTQNFNVSELGGGVIAYTAAETSPWISLTKTEGNTPDVVGVNVNISGITDGVYHDSIQVASAGATGSPIWVKVNLTVNPAPRLVATPDTLFFTATEGGSNPVGQPFHIAEQSGTSIGYVAAEISTWMSLSKLNGNTPDDIDVNVDITGLAPNTYTDSVIITSPVTPNGDKVIVRLVVNPRPKTLVATPDTLYFSAQEGAANPPSQNFHVAEALDAVVPYDLFETSAWMDLSKLSGNTPDDIGVNVNITGILTGVYLDSIRVTSSNTSVGNTEWVFVRLTITACPELIVSQSLFETTVFAGALLTYNDSVRITSSGVDGLPWAVANAASGFSFGSQSGVTPFTLTFGYTNTYTGIGTYDVCFDLGSTTPSGQVAAFACSSGVTVCLRIHVIEKPCIGWSTSDTVLAFTAFEGGEPNPAWRPFTVTTADSSSIPVGIFRPATNADWVKFVVGIDTLTQVNVNTPAQIRVIADPTGLTPGSYSALCWALTEFPDACQPFIRYFQVTLLVREVIIPSADTVIVANVPAVPGAQVAVPVTFVNSCPMTQMYTTLSWGTPMLHLDSVSYVGSRVNEVGMVQITTIDDAGNFANLTLNTTMDAPVAVGAGLWANLYFSVSPEALGGHYPINVSDPDTGIYFVRMCTDTPDVEVPEFVPGGIVVDSLSDFICGWVVDPEGNSIPGATVEMWADFPHSGVFASTMSTGIGSFAFTGEHPTPFDLYAYKAGYYPGILENLNFGTKGVKIVLRPLAVVPQSDCWTDYYCGENTLYGAPLPIGSVVEAFDQQGTLCGQRVVTELGLYRFMPVYADSAGSPEDEGATAGEVIRFFVNGEPAIAHGNVIYPNECKTQVVVCLEAGATQTKECQLHAGWNLVSWNLDTPTDEIVDVLNSIADCIDVVLGFEGGGLTYDPDLPMFSTLWYTDHTSGYWIKINEGCNPMLTIEGITVDANTPIPVYRGWNLVSYLPETVMAPQDALATVHNNLMIAYGFDNGIKIYQPGQAQFNTLTEMGSCFGYWMKLTANGSLVYGGGAPAVPAQENRHSLAAMQAAAALDLTPTTSWVNLYGSKLTLNGQTVRAGATIEAFTVKDTKVGSFTLKSDGLFGFMPVYADNGSETVTGLNAGDKFSLRIDGAKTEQTFIWTNNGDRIEVGALTAATGGGNLPTSYSLKQNYPNPFNPTTTLEFSLPVAMKAKIEVYNILGALVATPFDGMADAGTNSVVWDGKDARGQNVASGVYLYRLVADKYTETRKMMLLK